MSQYSLHNLENYNNILTSTCEEIQLKYNNLIAEYLFFVIENIHLKNDAFYKFIIQRGLITITNVFNVILLYSKNLDMSYYHSQKAFYFYVEFIGQISADQHTFLQLSSRDAIMFVYKKTIFDINNESKKKETECTKDEKHKLDILERTQIIQQSLIDIVIGDIDLHLSTRHAKMKCHMVRIEKIIKKILSFKFCTEQLDNIISFVERNKPYTKKMEEDVMYLIMDSFLKKYNSFIILEEKEKEKETEKEKYKKIKNKILNWSLDSQISNTSNTSNTSNKISINDCEKYITNIFS
jgi:hypothetical protein